ncbi:MAG: vitamin K epoxide reductase family protein [Patescibacteria group bacterium]
MNKNLKLISILFVVIGFVGFVDAAYLAVQHYTTGILPCYVFTGCDKVISSSYAVILGIPVSLIGAIYYLAIAISALLYIDVGYKKALNVLKNLPIAGFLATLWFLFLQIFIIRAICFYCMISAVTSSLLFILAIWLRGTQEEMR